MNQQEIREREAVVLEARSWIGTPYHHCSGIKGVGCDCAFLLKCVFENCGLIPLFDLPDYSPQWFLHHSQELYMGQVLKRAREIDETAAQAGDVVLFRIGHCYAHGGIITEWPLMVHAYSRARVVIESNGTTGEFSKRDSNRSLPQRARKFFTRW